MQKFLINKNSDRLILFFTGWGCDEYEFKHLDSDSDSDVLLLYHYSDFDLNFDFSEYKEINLIAFSAGVFVASVSELDFQINKKVAISGNPYLFDEHFGLSEDIQNILYNITIENADDFAKKYLVTDVEWLKFRHSNRTIDSCKNEFDNLKDLYSTHKKNIKDIFDIVLFGEEDKLFNVSAQKEFFGERLKIIKNARHNLFFKINKYEEIFELISG